jgi:hypothetical protein
LIIDGTECLIEKPHHNQSYWYSGRKKKFSIKYEVAVHPQTGQILWVGGGVGGSVHDLTMLREGGQHRYLRDDEYILGDSGYLGEPQVVAPFEAVTNSHNRTTTI